MATYFARKAGNINAADVWATTPSGTAAAVTFAAGDVLVANSFAITVNVSTDLGGSGQLRNDTTGGATAGGSFTLSNGVTLTASIYSSTTLTCVLFTAATPAVAYIAANEIRGNGIGSNQASGVNNSGTGTLHITVTNIFSGSANSGGIPSCGVINSGAGNTNITCSGLITGGAGTVSPGVANSNTTGVLTITGNVQGGLSANGALNTTTGTINIIGSAIGSAASGTAGVANSSTGTIRLTRAVGNAYGPGNTSGLAAAVGASNAGLGVIEIQELEYGTYGQSPTSGTGIRLKKLGSNVAVFNYCDTAGAKTLIDATQNAAMPAASNVRSGVSYASGALTGSCAVPAAGSVALGVPVDATTGTAVLTPEAVWGASTRTLTAGAGISASDVWDYATRSLTTSSGPTAVQIRQEMDSNSTKLANLDASISSRLATSGYTAPTSAPSVSDIRTELSVELGRLDASVSSRLASASYTAPANSDISAIKSKTDNLPASPAAVADIPTTAQIATAVEGSLLNEADGQAVLNALVGAIGNTNLSEVSLVAAVRADLERAGGKIDSIPTSSAPSASTVAGAVRTELATELGRLDASVSSRLSPSGTLATVTNLTNAPASVTPADIWDYNARTLTSASGPTAVEIRQEIDANSTKLDVAIGTRLAGSAYTAPANSDITAIKAKTDALPSDPADQSLLEAAIAGVAAPSAATVASAVRSELSTELTKVSALNTERLANVATTAIVGNLIAQANS